jgi:transcriptional regulator with XRE-family HTH domain
MTTARRKYPLNEHLRRFIGDSYGAHKNFAQKVGVTSSIVSLWYNGRAIPRYDLIVKIAKVTHNRVKPASWYGGGAR